MPLFQARQQRLLVHQAAAGDVEDPHPVAHPLDRRGIDKPFGLVGFREVDRDEVGRAEDRLGGSSLLHPQLPEALGPYVRVVSD